MNFLLFLTDTPHMSIMMSLVTLMTGECQILLLMMVPRTIQQNLCQKMITLKRL